MDSGGVYRGSCFGSLLLKFTVMEFQKREKFQKSRNQIQRVNDVPKVTTSKSENEKLN